jgi:hypothetical protein
MPLPIEPAALVPAVNAVHSGKKNTPVGVMRTAGVLQRYRDWMPPRRAALSGGAISTGGTR